MKRRTDTHEPIITAYGSGCTCGRWSGPNRSIGEAQGPFTIRAKSAHDEHLADLQTQGEIFPALTGLFVEGDALA